MYNRGQNVYLWKHAIALAVCVSVLATVLVIALAKVSAGTAQEIATPGSHSTPLAPVPRGDLEAIYHQAWLTIRDNYIDQGKLSDWQKWQHKFDGQIRTDKQLAEALEQMLAALSDKHTLYLPAAKLKSFEMAQLGNVVGIGVGLSGPDEIVFVLPNAPADKAGLQRGDRIIAVDGQPTTGMSSKQLVAAVRGEEQPKTKVVLTIVRNHTILRVAVVREVLKTKPACHGHLDPKKPEQTFLHINNLRSEAVVDELVTGLTDLNKQDIKGLILDLRELQGGSGLTAARVAALFLGEGVIVHAVERNLGRPSTITYEVNGGKLVVSAVESTGRKTYTTVETPINCFTGAVIVLVDEQTSGAAELIAAALKENKRALVVGTNTAGKGIGQCSIFLNAKHAMRVSTRQYLTPSHTPINSTGVVPDVVVSTASRRLVFTYATAELYKRIAPPSPTSPVPVPGK